MLRILEKNKIVVAVAAVILLFAGTLYYILSDHAAQTEGKPVNPDKLVEFNGSQVEEKDNGKLVWKLTAEKIKVDPDTNIMYFTHPQAVVADVDGKELTINADSGTLDRNKKIIEVKPPITASTKEGDTLATDGSVYYNMDTRIINGGKVYIKKSDGTELSGDSFTTNAALDDVTLQGHAKISKEKGE